MERVLQIEFEDTVHHVTSHGLERQVFAFAVMNNHFHQAPLPYGLNDSGCFANH